VEHLEQLPRAKQSHSLADIAKREHADESMMKRSGGNLIGRRAESSPDLLRGSPTAERTISFGRQPCHMNRVLRAGPDAVIFAAAVFGPRKGGYRALGFQASGATRLDAEPTTSAGIFDNHGEPLVRQLFLHSLLLASHREQHGSSPSLLQRRKREMT
jgi:hypothetical protein